MNKPPPRKPSPRGKGLLPLLAIAAPIIAFVAVAMNNAQDGAKPQPVPDVAQVQTVSSAQPIASETAVADQVVPDGGAQQGISSWFDIKWPWERSDQALPMPADPAADPAGDAALAAQTAMAAIRPTASASAAAPPLARNTPSEEPTERATQRPKPECREVCTGGDSGQAGAQRTAPMRYLGDTHYNLKRDTAPSAGKRFADQKCGGVAREMQVIQDECSGDICFIRVSASCLTTRPLPAEPRRCRKVCT